MTYNSATGTVISSSSRASRITVPAQPPHPFAQVRTASAHDLVCAHRCLRKHLFTLNKCGLNTRRVTAAQCISYSGGILLRCVPLLCAKHPLGRNY